MTANIEANKPQVLKFDRRPNKEEMLRAIDKFRQSVTEGDTISAILISIEEGNILHATCTSARPVSKLMYLGALTAVTNGFTSDMDDSDEP